MAARLRHECIRDPFADIAYYDWSQPGAGLFVPTGARGWIYKPASQGRRKSNSVTDIALGRTCDVPKVTY